MEKNHLIPEQPALSQTTSDARPKLAEASIDPQLTLDVVHDPNKATRTMRFIYRFDNRLYFPTAMSDSQILSLPTDELLHINTHYTRFSDAISLKWSQDK